MFGALLRRLTATIEGAIGQVVSRAIVAVPFLVALAFTVAALHMWLSRVLGAEMGSLVLAVIFAATGVVAAMLMPSPVVAPERNQPPVATTAFGEAASPGDLVGLSPEDRKLLMAAASTIAPAVVPGLGRLLIRNLPLVAAIAAAAFVMTRPEDTRVSLRSKPAE